MFFSTYVLTKKGPLAKIWLAAHWEKKLTKNEIRAIDLNQTIVQIVQPVVPIALRTSGELLIGVVRVYALKVKQLLKDATDATVLLRAANVQLVPGKGGVPGSADYSKDAVTMDLVVVGKGGAEDLCEADFNGIADLLKGNRALPGGIGSNAAHDAGDVVGTAWFTLEPSQYLEEQMQGSQNVDDGIAKIRADLLALGDDRRTESTGSKKSSISSVEKGRTSHMVLGDDMLDVGAPLPDDLLLAPAPDTMVGDQMLDPNAIFDVPDLQPVLDAAAEAESGPKLPKKLKVVNVLDAAATVLSKADMEKCNRDRSDIVNDERRFGPRNAEEEHDRTMVRAGEGSVVNIEPVSLIPNPALRAVYSAALSATVEKLRRETEAARASHKMPERASRGAAPEILPDDFGLLDMGANVAAPEFDFTADIPAEAAQPAARASRGKRSRDEEGNDKETPFSASTLATLEALRGVLRGKSETTFSAFARGMRRLEAARSFVDVLAIASHNVVEVRQQAAFGDIQIVRTAQLTA